MAEYNPKEIEAKWQQYWQDNALFRTPAKPDPKKKKYVLVEFPYPSGDGLHVGHAKIYTATDVAARYHRMRGYDVLHPMGWDAFGLPAENSAIKFGVHPAELTERNTTKFKEQMLSLGLSYDWEREINTTDPDYYKWTQWIFLQLFKRGLAYEDTIPINWCPSCKTGLANEEVIDGHCARCGHVVEQKPMRQWMLKITAYADQLLAGLDDLDWPTFIKDIQRNWIGRSEGINITYDIVDSTDTVTCFTTRPDTNFGATFVVVAPEHNLATQVAADNKEVAAYIDQASRKTERQRQEEDRIKTGVFTGRYAINQLTGKKMPIWVSDFVIGHFGTGAVVGVPGHDLRDFEFAQTFDLPIIRVVVGPDGDTTSVTRPEQVQEKTGAMMNSDFLDGLPIDEATTRMMDHMETEGYGERVTTYSLRDWVFSRQRYWGEPIPLIHCQECGIVPVPEAELPVTLPEVTSYEPTGTGESPLAGISDWVNVSCPTCDGAAKRETNTMPQWAGSSWYWIRFTDHDNTKALADPKKIKQWLPVDIYVGGAEHAVLHLLYGRFWNMVLHDIGAVNTAEPFTKRHIVGLVLGEDGQKMSKSRGNVVNPDDEIAKYGADTVRIFASFMGPFEGSAAWTTAGITGSERFMKRLWRLFMEMPQDEAALTADLNLAVQQTIKRVTESMEHFRFNTAVSSLMELLNTFEKDKAVAPSALQTFALLLSPLAPHLAEEAWQSLGNDTSVTLQPWPEADAEVLAGAQVTIPVQINGKVRGTLTTDSGQDEAAVVEEAKGLENVTRHLEGKEIVKTIYVPDKLLNLVVK
ncbi:leucine--tRNA ligase [bacterium]|nr:leucine--tRNA ligase [bacterium]